MTESMDKKVFIYILIAFAFSIGIRMIWVYQFGSIESFLWNGQLMINTNDGYYYAEGARDVIKGAHEANDFSPISSALSLLTAFFAKILPFSFESIVLYMPTFLSSLLIIPLILIAKRLKALEAGFIAALLGSIAWSYYNRTMSGYYDTDMLNIVFPTFILYFFIASIQDRSLNYALLASFSIIAYTWWYSPAYSLMFAFAGLILIYTILTALLSKRAAKKEKLCEHLQKCNDLGFIQEDFVYFYKLCAFIFVASCTLHVGIRLALIGILYIVFLKKNLSEKNIFFIFIASLVLFLGSGVLGMAWGKLQYYVVRDKVVGGGDDIKLFFFTSNQTVRESSAIPFDLFTNRISGSMITFFISLIGYMYLCFKHRIMLLTLPMVALGFIAYKNGLRFTIYAVPFMALGFGYLVFEIVQKIKNNALKYAFVAIASIAVLAPNILHAIDYKVPTVFNAQEVKIIDDLGKKASREDYVLAWWDYGYPVRYYADMRTLVDGGASKYPSNLFETSYILNAPQKNAANMARLAVEYKIKEFDTQEHNKNLDKDDKNYIKMPSNNVAWMMRDYGFTNPNDFLQSLSLDMKLPKKTRDIYLYLPYRMVNIFPTVGRFSYRDLINGKDKKMPFFYQATKMQKKGDRVDLGSGVSLDMKKGILNIQNSPIPIKSFYKAGMDNDFKINVVKQDINSQGLNVLFASSYGTMFVLDDNALNSTYMQLFFLGNYDKNLYELVGANPYARIYKLKQ